MSKAGIQSNRGDGYQTLVAFDWALTVLSNPDYQWLEVDSVTTSVDDVVIGKVDGTKICCQCKKNQTLHKAWSIADLADELRKACTLLNSDSHAVVRFYSRSAFGEIAALREHSTIYADESTYKASLGNAQKVTDAELERLIAGQVKNLSTYQFLQRTTFEISPELERFQTLLRERLQQLASNLPGAYSALWARLDHLGMRMDGDTEYATVQHRITKNDLKTLLANAGALLTPPMSMRKVRDSFCSTSAIGRSWRRDIGDHRIPCALTNQLIEAIEAKHRSILLTGLPGSGKTCVMLSAQDALEQLVLTRNDLLPLFIQSREFADVVTAQDRHAQGLSEQWVEEAARMAENAHVVVMIDSLDVLSIAREHGVLAYFLAQIDRLLLVPNITVVTACRDFDRHYDRRIAQRVWDVEFTCQPLDWDAEIAPLLATLSIDTSMIDVSTRELIRNPRELALFVELAQQGGSFNVVTSQALAQRYLDTIVKANNLLGDDAMLAIEAIASEMLKLRRLTVPNQWFAASQDIQRMLLSHNVLHLTQDGHLTFGHQTLLDVLVISGALRNRVTLNEFIRNLPSVPFVRPSIRSFVTQLASGDRRNFRMQLRTVLTGSHAFHIRRLVAETFAEQIPLDDDWPLVRDLRSQHREVFQVIYTQAVRVEWHSFWMRHLVPVLKNTCDADGLTMHMHRVSQWKNNDAAGVFTFWTEALALDWIDSTRIANSLAQAITETHTDHSALCITLLIELLKLPRQEHSLLGRALVQCAKGGKIDDALLWDYIAGEVRDENVLAYSFDQSLHCQPHEFGDSNNTFLADRMQKSTALLDLAIASIERWRHIKYSRLPEAAETYWSGFLGKTSHSDAHTRTELRHIDSERLLMNAVEAAIICHAKSHSDWWVSNRERLCFGAEDALRYFAILACTAEPSANLDIAGRMLCDTALLKSNLSYQLGTLMQTVYVHIDAETQDAIQVAVLALHHENSADPMNRAWAMRRRAQLVLTVPCHMRTYDAQAVLDEVEREEWPLVRQPDIYMSGGMINAPFTFQVFLDISDGAVLLLLNHYNGHVKRSFDEFLVGGESEVGRQLHEAASRHPTRFVNLLARDWESIPGRFRDDIMSGVADYLEYRYGNLQPNGDWFPTEKPVATSLAHTVLDELEKHSNHWHHNRAASQALQGCAYIVTQIDSERIVPLARDFSTLQEMRDSGSLLETGINMTRGNAALALMILANRFMETDSLHSETLASALRLFAVDAHPAIRALLLLNLPHLQRSHPELGWELFALSMKEYDHGLWAIAERCLYHAYHQKFETVAPWLAHLYRTGCREDFKVWGRISALAALSEHLDFSIVLEELEAVNTPEAWSGAASVWTNPSNLRQHKMQCFAGLEAGLNAKNQHALSVARKMRKIFHEGTAPVVVPIELVRRCFELLITKAAHSSIDIHDVDAWLNAISLSDPMYALNAVEIYLAFVRHANQHIYEQKSNFTQLLTRLFMQAEENEESDCGAMLRRVIAIQDALLTLGLNSVNNWLKAAERP